MAESIPSQINFSQLLSHTFPGIFTTISIFMMIDIIFHYENVIRVFQIGIIFENWITFIVALSGLVFFGTITGVIIDSIHHMIVSKIIDVENTEIIIKNKYLFSWDEISGKDNKRLIGFLKKRFNIEWVDEAKIEKIDDDKTIRVYFENNCLYFKLNDDETEIIVIIDDVETDEFIVKQQNDKLNIYKNKTVIEKIIDFIHPIIVWKTKEGNDPIKEINDDEAEVFLDLKNGKRVGVYYFIGFLPLERFQFLIDNLYSYVECEFNLSISFFFSSFIYGLFIFKCGCSWGIALVIFLIMIGLSIIGFFSAVKLYIKFRKNQLDIIKGAIKHYNDVTVP